MRFLRFTDLRSKGIDYSKPSLWRLMKEGKFPPPVKGLGVELCWAEDQIDKYIADRVAAAREKNSAAA